MFTGNPYVLLKIAENLIADEKKAEALDYVKRAINAAPEDPRVQESGANLLTAIQQFNEAFELWKKFINLGDEQIRRRNTHDTVIMLLKHGYEFVVPARDYNVE
jgi:tetratricopeptide (TPR) repeat protein